MIELNLFGADQSDEMYETLLERVQRIAARYTDQVAVNEYALDSDEARELGIGRAPALALGDKLLYVGSVPTAREVAATIAAAVTRMD
jgi:hypothetical protein